MQTTLRKNWCFTVNNYTEEDVNLFSGLLEKEKVDYIIYGKEKGETGTKHLQGYLQMKKEARLTAMKKLHKTAHWEAARGNAKENKKYCEKEGDVYESGTMVIAGKRKLDMVKAVAQIIKKVPTETLLEEHGAGYVMNKRKLEETAKDIQQQTLAKLMKTEYENFVLRPWQQEVVNKIKEQDNRKILWVVDPIGNSGKTELSKYLIHTEGAIRYQNGKSNDILYMYKGEPIIVFDLSRSQLEHINYGVIEDLKNGVFCCYKYESTMKMFKPPKMVIMMNKMPDMTALSIDRYDIYKIKKTIEEDLSTHFI